MKIFNTNDTEYKYRNGQKCTVMKVIDKPDKTHDAEVLPMFVVEFEDGEQIEVWSDEIEEK